MSRRRERYSALPGRASFRLTSSSLLGPYYQQAQQAQNARILGAATARKAGPCGYRDPRSGALPNRPYAKFSRTSLHSTISATRRPGQRYPLKEKVIVRKFGMLLAVASVMALAACGGSGGGSTTSSTITSVTAACSPTTILYGQTSQCSATVMGTGNFSSAVTWTASAGSISTSGLFTAPGTEMFHCWSRLRQPRRRTPQSRERQRLR